jgi:hypothetical protein
LFFIAYFFSWDLLYVNAEVEDARKRLTGLKGQ